MTTEDTPIQAAPRTRGSVFWKVALLLVGVQILVGLLAVSFSAYFALDASLDLVRNSLRLRLDGLAEEVELRVPTLDQGLEEVPQALLNDIATRFPDPVTLVAPDGSPVITVMPDALLFPESDSREDPIGLSPQVAQALESGDVVIEIGDDESMGIAPIYDPTGFLAGGLVVHPLTNSIDRELADTRSAFFRALTAVTVLAGIVALLIGAILTWRIVRPLRSIAEKVERIGQGDYSARLSAVRDDEFGRLAESVNVMARKVEESFEALVSADQLRRDLVANIGHDLRTPLTAMRGYIDEAGRALKEGERDTAIGMLETASKQTVYISALVSDLFELALLDRPNPPLHLEPVPMGELAAQAVDSQAGLFVESGRSLSLDSEDGLPVIRADGVRLLRLLNNLLDNARKHGREGGKVRVLVRGLSGRVEVVVEDDGPGIEPKELESLFERYYRGDGPRTRRGSSTGLGLAISRAIAEAHGGNLTVTSKKEEGTRFRLVLPVDGPEG
ncbi:MAG: HAMP domain-containing histidine kinase [Rhodothermia bacterium]|nr:HAMP domain-containing histidine kinase [Rhodothermia bacterium]